MTYAHIYQFHLNSIGIYYLLCNEINNWKTSFFSSKIRCECEKMRSCGRREMCEQLIEITFVYSINAIMLGSISDSFIVVIIIKNIIWCLCSSNMRMNRWGMRCYCRNNKQEIKAQHAIKHGTNKAIFIMKNSLNTAILMSNELILSTSIVTLTHRKWKLFEQFKIAMRLIYLWWILFHFLWKSSQILKAILLLFLSRNLRGVNSRKALRFIDNICFQLTLKASIVSSQYK